MAGNGNPNWVKGQDPGCGHRFTKENAREMQKRANEARSRNKTMAETLRKALEAKSKKDKKLTRLEWLVLSALDNSEAGISLRDLKDIQAILGEAVQNVNVTGDPKIVEMTEDAVQSLGKWASEGKE